MRSKLNIFFVWPLAALLVFVPVFCCCLTRPAHAQDHQTGMTAKRHSCCESQSSNTDTVSRPDANNCHCPQHLFSKAANYASAEGKGILTSHQTPLDQISGSGLVLLSPNLGHASAEQKIHSPPLQVVNPLYIKLHNLRI